MIQRKFNEDWTFEVEGVLEKRNVTLPHDAALQLGRAADSPGKDAYAFYQGGIYVYEKQFFVSSERAHMSLKLLFDGVYKNAAVYLNDELVGEHKYGYTPFVVPLTGKLKTEQQNTIKVVADNSKLPNSRWYAGGGIYRDVYLLQGNREHILWNGVKIDTTSIDPATIRVQVNTNVDLENPAYEIITEIKDQGISIATVEKNGECVIKDALLWSQDTPKLYQYETNLYKNGEIIDKAMGEFGIRQLSWNRNGFFINGKKTLLKGGCIHLDNGILGVCSYAKSEDRKVKILKENGYNALRISHNPASETLLRACDKYGMYVMDEAFDMWFTKKNKHDYANDFYDNYEKDITAMVQRDYNHPSVIMYSIGNELSEPVSTSEEGLSVAKKIIDLVHDLDSSRPVTAGANLFILMMTAKGKGLYDEGGMASKYANKEVDETAGTISDEPKSGSLFFNTMMSTIGKGLNRIANSKKADEASAPFLDMLDIAGYNYASGRYKKDKNLHPDRLIMGSETYPQDIADNWKLIGKDTNLIGDFMWTAWDYIGEAAIGSWNYKGVSMTNVKYPWALSEAGTIDILGYPGAQAKYAACIWGCLDKPYIGIRPINHSGIRVTKAAWRGTNAFDSWSWRDCEGEKAVVEIYADAYKAELLLNNKKIGSKKLKKRKALFKCKYKRGELKVKCYDSYGKLVGENKLQSAKKDTDYVISCEESYIDVKDIYYFNIEIADRHGVVESNQDKKIKIEVENGTLLGFGSAKPDPIHEYLSNSCVTYYGRAQAVIKPISQGSLIIKITDEDNNVKVQKFDVL